MWDVFFSDKNIFGIIFSKNIDKIKKLLYSIEYTNYRRVRK